MFDSMTAAGAWTPIQDMAYHGSGMERSHCLTCPHIKEHKDVCKLRLDCPIRIPTILPPTDRESPTSKKQWHECAFPGCKNKTTREYCSNGCAQTVYYRKKKYPDNPELWHVPRDNQGGKQTLKSKYKRGKK